jgi:N-acetylmuramoyl-L-alanine amidase
VTRSKAAALSIERKLIAATGALDHGSSAGGSVPGFAYSAVPVVLVEVGFQSNRVEDRLLASPRYQDLIGDGIATGVLAYLNGGGR